MINENILTELKQLKQSIEEVSVYDLNVYSSMELYSRVAGKINELIKEVMTYQGILSEELLKELDYINNHMDTFLYEIRTNSEMAINDMNIAKDEMIEQVTNQINENQLLINSLLNYSNRLSYLERMLDLLFSENVSHRTKLIIEGNHLSLANSKEGLIQINSTGGNTLVNIIQSHKKGDNTVMLRHGGLLKTNTIYTLIAPAFDSNVNEMYVGYKGSDAIVNYQSSNIVSFNTGDSILSDFIYCYYKGDDSTTYINNVPLKYIILEGDYTNKPIPDYFTGMQSSFEDKLVTQEMVDSGKELAENLGKYKVEYKVIGKNKFSGYIDNYAYNNNGELEPSNNFFVSKKIDVRNLKSFKLIDTYVIENLYAFDKQGNFIEKIYKNGSNITVSNNTYGYISMRYVKNNNLGYDLNSHNTQLEEGSTATAYEPYKESFKTYYLNSPLLEGDTIEESNGNVYHVHRYNKVVLDGSNDMINYDTNVSTDICDDTTLVYQMWLKDKEYYPAPIDSGFCDKIQYMRYDGGFGNSNNFGTEAINTGGGYTHFYLRLLKSKLPTEDANGFRSYLQSNPLIVVYPLASPTREIISENDDLMMKCFNNSSIDYDSVIPVEKTDVTFTGEGTSTTSLLVDDINLETDEITRESIEEGNNEY